MRKIIGPYRRWKDLKVTLLSESEVGLKLILPPTHSGRFSKFDANFKIENYGKKLILLSIK